MILDMKRVHRIVIALTIFSVFYQVSIAKEGPKGEPEASLLLEEVYVLPNTAVKNQAGTSTCWSFSALSFFESELLRLGKKDMDLSEMFVVWHTYSEKARKYVRMHGNIHFSGGGAFHDVTNMIRTYGMVPESVYDGLHYGEERHMHGEMDRVLKSYVEGVVTNRNGNLSTAWDEGFEAILDSYLGELPGTFEFDGTEYTPQKFAREYVGLDMDDYVEITSFTHHPFYSRFILEVPDNWSWDEVFNVPLHEMEEIIDHSLASGYTVAWASDISEKGFLSSRTGLAQVAENEVNVEVKKDFQTIALPDTFQEATITQEMRQAAFDNYQTTDDHGMHIVGTAHDTEGNVYYVVKNSWGEYNKFDGFFYATKAYVKYKTTCIMVHRDGIPKPIRRKLSL
jgi:bleomycin hydrolase